MVKEDCVFPIILNYSTTLHLKHFGICANTSNMINSFNNYTEHFAKIWWKCLHKQDMSMKHTLGECDMMGVLLYLTVVSRTDSHHDGTPAMHITPILSIVNSY
jgi:hypothetical protein